MIGIMRKRLGPLTIGLVMGAIALVFIFYGVFAPRNQGVAGPLAGSVNGEAITMSDFNRMLEQRMAIYRHMNMDPSALNQMGLRPMIFDSLVRQKLLVQEAKKMGLDPSDEAVRDEIIQVQAFQENGVFSKSKYKDILERNGLTPAAYERMVKEDLIQKGWFQYFEELVPVSDVEVHQDYSISEEKRVVQYILLSKEVGKKKLTISSNDIQKAVDDPVKQNIIKGRYEAGKDTLYKGMKYEQARDLIAQELLRNEKNDEVMGTLREIANKTLAQLKATHYSEGSMNAWLKPYESSVKKSASLTFGETYVPGIGDVKELTQEIFLPASPLNPKKGGHAKAYDTARGVVVAWTADEQGPKLEDLNDKKLRETKAKVGFMKQRRFFEAWFKKIRDNAKVLENKEVTRPEA